MPEKTEAEAEEEREAQEAPADSAEDDSRPDTDLSEAPEAEAPADEDDAKLESTEEAVAAEDDVAEAAEDEQAQDREDEEEADEEAVAEAEPEAAEAEEPTPAVQVPIVADGQPQFHIVVPAEPTDVESFAAAELAKYLEKICGASLEVKPGGEGIDKAILIGGVPDDEMAERGVQDDGFVIDVTPEAIRLFGGKGRGTLFAVYALLERLGCRWPIPGEEHEYTPHRGAIEVDAESSVENPRFAVRSFVEDSSFVDHDDEAQKEQRIVDDTEFIDWLAKNRCSHFMFRAPEDVFELLHFELDQRGLSYEGGGHIIPQLLPRELFEERPGLFRMSTKGNREPSGNLCVSNSDALELVRENFLKYLESVPEADVIHFWGEDVADGGWCCCSQCRELLPQDQYLTACNFVAEALEDKDVTIDYIAYHDTLEADLTLEPHPAVMLLFAPRERCYGHSIGDPECETNQLYADALRQYVETFAGNVQVFEYYADALLYGSLAVPLHHVIAEDLGFYESLGIGRVQSLMFGRFSRWAYPLNMYAFARLAWDTEADVDQITRDFCQASFGEAADPMRRVSNILEEGMRQVATYGDIKQPWRSEASPRTMHERILAAVDVLAMAREPMAKARQEVEDTRMESLVLNQYQLWLYTLGEVEGTATQVDGLAELESAQKAEDTLKAKYLRVADLKLRDAAGIHRGGMDMIAEVADEVKGQWGITGLMQYHDRVISHLEKVAQEARDRIPPEPEEEPKPEPEPEEETPPEEGEAEAAEGAPEAETEPAAVPVDEAEAETEADGTEAEEEPEQPES